MADEKKPTGPEAAAKFVDMAKDWYNQIVLTEAGDKWRENAVESTGFYQGTKQWDEAAKRLLQAQGRPALTINRILPIVNVIWGGQLKNRQELRLYPRRGGTTDVANLGSSLIEHGMDTCNGYDAISDCFRDGLITGKGWVAIDRDFENDPFNGDLDVSAANPLFVYEDPRNTHYDINRGEFIFRESLKTASEMEPYYPGEMDEIFAAMTGDWSKEWLEKLAKVPGAGLTAIANVFDQNAYGNGEGGEVTHTSSGQHLKAIILRECWYRTHAKVLVASLTMRDGQVHRTRITDPANRKKLEDHIRKTPDTSLRTVEAVVPTLHLLTMVGDKLLKHEEDPLNGMHTFPFVRFAPYWHHGEAFGVIDNLKDPQREHNKNRSQALHLLNQSGNTGWKGKKPTPKGLAMIENYGSTPGIYIDETEFGGMLERLKPEQLSQGHMVLAEAAPLDMEKISGANADMFGSKSEKQESGRARRLRIEWAQTPMAPILGNLRRSQRTLGTTIFNYIRHNDVYSVEEVFAVTDETIIEALGGPEAAVEAMNRWDVGNYSVKADTTPSTATHRDAMIEEVRAVAMFFLETGLQLPPELGLKLIQQVMKMSSFPGRDEMIDMLQNAQLQTNPDGPQAGADRKVPGAA
ncbi:MAG: hypothetical protein HQ582_34020 [Planctomycetes bacterium]|nr:hypothetical protein [Planctomycetota bacterium]